MGLVGQCPLGTLHGQCKLLDATATGAYSFLRTHAHSIRYTASPGHAAFSTLACVQPWAGFLNKGTPMKLFTGAALSSEHVLTKAELRSVIDYHTQRQRCTRYGTQGNLVIVRLAACCGLRRREIADLRMRDFLTGGIPKLIIRHGKGDKYREVTLDFNAETLKDLLRWRKRRVAEGAQPDDPFVCRNRNPVMAHSAADQPLSGNTVATRWRTALRRALSPERVEQLSVHSGRHTCATMLLDAGMPIARVAAILGHVSCDTTYRQYFHLTQQSKVEDAFV